MERHERSMLWPMELHPRGSLHGHPRGYFIFYPLEWHNRAFLDRNSRGCIPMFWQWNCIQPGTSYIGTIYQSGHFITSFSVLRKGTSEGRWSSIIHWNSIKMGTRSCFSLPIRYVGILVCTLKRHLWGHFTASSPAVSGKLNMWCSRMALQLFFQCLMTSEKSLL